MAVYSITYDLNKQGKDYESLYKEIKSLGAWAHYLESTWFVDTSLSSQEIRDKLLKVMDSDDSLFVAKMVIDYSGRLNEDAWKWLKEHLR